MFIFVIPLVFFLIYLYLKRKYNYWKTRGIKFEEPRFLAIGILTQFMENISASERFANLYRKYPNEKFVGNYEGTRPGLLIRDPELIKRVLLTDFRNFHCRGANFYRDITEPLMKNLFNADGDTWKLMRQKLTPAFTSGKLKAMFPLIVKQTEKLLQIADGLAKTGDEVDVRELMARYTTDFIGACGFGINADTMNDVDSNFRKLGKRIFTMSMRDAIVLILKSLTPGHLKSLHIFSQEVENGTISLVQQIMAQRNYKPSGRNDFIDMLLELRQKKTIVGESLEKHNLDGTFATTELEINDSLLAAQVFIFFAAGFETSSSASSFLLHLLAYHPDKQTQCQQEIEEVLKRYDGKLSYDAVREMKYLEMAFKEAIRILPSPGFLLRKSVTKYTFPGTDLTIDEDIMIIISLEALHSDEKYFENPEEFRPERFHPDNIDNITKQVYMPFGDGPRACIGERLGIMQSIAGVAAVLNKFTVSPSKSSVRKPRIDFKSVIVQIIIGGLPLSLKQRK